MITRERRLLEQLVKSWAQDHHSGYQIADYDPTGKALDDTSGFFTWLIRESHANIDLMSLVDRLEIFLESRRKRTFQDGMKCQKCKNFYEFAEPNQPDGSLLCYSCRNSPFI